MDLGRGYTKGKVSIERAKAKRGVVMAETCKKPIDKTGKTKPPSLRLFPSFFPSFLPTNTEC